MRDDAAEILERLRGTEPGPEAVRAAADRIVALGEPAVPCLLEALGDEDEAVLTVVAASLRRLSSPAVMQRLVTLLRSPRLGDLAKALLLGVLEDGGMDIHDPSLVGTLADLEGMLFSSRPSPPPTDAAGGNGGGQTRAGGSR